MNGVSTYQKIFIVSALLTVVAPQAVGQTADQIGRLFSTPRERAELDQIRNTWLQDIDQLEMRQDIESGEQIQITPPVNLYLRLDGTVRHADNSHTVWINGQAVPQDALPENIRLARVGDLIVLWVNYVGKLFVVRPGQLLHFATEAVYEDYLLPPELRNLLALAPAASIDQDSLSDATTPEGILPSSDNAITEDAAETLEQLSTLTGALNPIEELAQ